MLRALHAELAKLRRSKAPLWTALVVVVWPLTSMEMVLILDVGVENATWEWFMRSNAQAIASWYGFVLFGFVAAFVFGREFSEQTARTMFTLPVRREYFMLAKLIILLAWVLALTLLSVVARAGCGAVLGLNGFAWEYVVECVKDSLLVSLLVSFTLPFVGWLAIYGRGYLAPMIFSAFALLASMMFLQAGWERWFPWSMPLTVAGSSWVPMDVTTSLVAGSWAISSALFVVGIGAILLYTNLADNVD